MPSDAAPAALLDLTGRAVLVAGGSGGIGAGIVDRFVAAGAHVTMSYHRGGHDTDRGASLGAHPVRSDLTLAEGAERLVSDVIAREGRLDAVVNAAGVQPVTALTESGVEEWRAVLEANLTAAHLLTRAAAAVMSGGGSVTHLASIEASQPAAGHAHYGASKAGLVAYARAAAVEYGPHDVRVNTVSPGLVHRAGIEEAWPDGVRRWRSAAPLRRLGRADDIAHACLFLASPMAVWVTGHDLVVDGGVTAVPTW